MSSWSLVYTDYNSGKERLREALCTLGNGYIATRGAAADCDASDHHYPGTYMAGLYNRLESDVAGRTITNEDLVNIPNWLPLTFRIEQGPWFHTDEADLLEYRQQLDMRRGLLLRSVVVRDKQGRESRLHWRRFVHIEQRNVLGQELTLTPLNWSGTITVRAGLDGSVINAGVARYRDLNSHHLEVLETCGDGKGDLFLRTRASQSRVEIAMAARITAWRGDERDLFEGPRGEDPRIASQEACFRVEQDTPLILRKLVTVHTSRDNAISECGLESRDKLQSLSDFDDLVRRQSLAWKNLWNQFDIALDLENGQESEKTTQVLRTHLFHLLQTVSKHTRDLDAGAPARGWHGEAYRGHIFWDELFVFPILNLRIPEITRHLLMYRYRRLGRARLAAERAGYRGAMFPWQSGSDGREESQLIHLNPRSGEWGPDNSHLQRHINAAIAYNVWSYYEVTCDEEFLWLHGAEMFLDIARFWASATTLNPDRGRYEIRGVMGPDEYHEKYPGAEEGGLDNNTYTNVMASWILSEAPKILAKLPADRREELLDKLDLRPEELEQWDDISRRLYLHFQSDGILSQFEGYEKLEEFPWEQYRHKYGDIQRLDRVLKAEKDSPDRFKASKQADVVMLFYLFSSDELEKIFAHLGYDFDRHDIPRHIDYYMARTSHGSTLSNVVHSWVLARSDREGSWDLFDRALRSDIDDIQGGTTEEGIHLGAMSGTIDLVQRCFTGLETRGDTLLFNPRLPRCVRRLQMKVRYRSHTIRVEVTCDELTLCSLATSPSTVRVGVKDRLRVLEEGEEVRFPLHEGRG